MATAGCSGVIRLFALATAGLLFGACAEAPDLLEDPNAGLLRDFLDGKFDSAGHPLNAKVLDAETACGARTLRGPCAFTVPAGAMTGDLVVNVRLRVTAAPHHGAIVKVRLLDNDKVLATRTLSVSNLRGRSTWIDLGVEPSTTGTLRTVSLEPAEGATVEVDYVEVFPKRFGLVAAPGSGVYGDDDMLTFEVPRGRKLERLDLDGVDVMPHLETLFAQGKATRTTTAFRTMIETRVGDLLPTRAEVAELRVRTGGHAARIQLRRELAPCNFEGDPEGKKVLVTGFQPFPADGWHDNISAVAVTAMDPAAIRGARVMRLVLPVEYDRAPDAIVEVIHRCAPDIVISFGQGGSAIALEQTAYNLQDTGEISGGVPDNRGVIRAAVAIDESAPATRDTLLPLTKIEAALEALGEAPRTSTDPGRYICNNTMFTNIGAMTGVGAAGFIHLPYTTQFDDAVRARFARVVEAAIQATVDAP
jgi:pyroglutamyl-peptidase